MLSIMNHDDVKYGVGDLKYGADDVKTDDGVTSNDDVKQRVHEMVKKLLNTIPNEFLVLNNQITKNVAVPELKTDNIVKIQRTDTTYLSIRLGNCVKEAKIV